MEKLDKGPFVIADVSSNHRGSLDLALEHVTAAKKAGASAVKFQLYRHEDLYGVPAPEGHERTYEMNPEWLYPLKQKCDETGIEFMVTPFSPGAVTLVNNFVRIHKLASSEMKHVQMLDALKATGKPIIVSTGGAHFSEIWNEEQNPVTREFKWCLLRHLAGCKVTLLECVANYPAEPQDYNLTAMNSWRKHGVEVGISDHTVGNVIAAQAARVGATVFEKHFDCALGDKEETPDSMVSASRSELKAYIEMIHRHMRLPRDLQKRPEFQDQMALKWRRKLKVTKDLKAGDTLKMNENFGIYRSLEDDGHAGPPEAWPFFEGKRVKKDMKPQDGLWTTDVE